MYYIQVINFLQPKTYKKITLLVLDIERLKNTGHFCMMFQANSVKDKAIWHNFQNTGHIFHNSLYLPPLVQTSLFHLYSLLPATHLQQKALVCYNEPICMKSPRKRQLVVITN